MAKWNIYTPEGFRDVLFDECYSKRNIENKIRNIFRKRGFLEIETPALEFYDAFSPESGLIEQETMFKFFDEQGRILVMRPDATIPVARVAATKFADKDMPLRVSYLCNTFRYNELGGGKLKEFTAAGVEIIGEGNPEADAEVIATAIKTIISIGIDSFQIDLGQMQFFKGIMEDSGLSEQETEQIRVLIDRKDFIGVEEIVKARGLDENLRTLILGLSGFYGSIDVIDKLRTLTNNKRALIALDNLESVYNILKDYGYEKYISLDLGMLQNPNFYTGIIFKGFTYDVGFPILRGGRYDGLVAKFGKELPATGFSMGVNMLMTALERQNEELEKPRIDTIVGYEESGCVSKPSPRQEAIAICEELRRQGLNAQLDIVCKDRAGIENYAKNEGIDGYLYVKEAGVIEVCNLKTGEVEELNKAELLGEEAELSDNSRNKEGGQ